MSAPTNRSRRKSMNSQRIVSQRMKLRLGIPQHAAFLGFGARVLEQFGVIDAGGTGRHACQAAETKIHFIGERFRGVQPAIGDGAHERNASARAVALEFGGIVSRAGRQAKAAMHALLDDRVIQPAQLRMPPGGGRWSGPNCHIMNHFKG